MAKPSLTRLPRDQKETRAGEDCGLLVCDGGRAQLRLRVGRFFLGDTPKSSVILGNLKTVSDGAAVICCRGYPVHYYLQSRQQLWLKAEPNRTNLAWCSLSTVPASSRTFLQITSKYTGNLHSQCHLPSPFPTYSHRLKFYSCTACDNRSIQGEGRFGLPWWSGG